MPPLVKYIIFAVLVMIIAALGVALYHLATGRKRPADDTTMVKALAVRVGLSIGLFTILMVLYLLGIVTPNG